MNITDVIRDAVHQPYFACLLSGLACLCFYFLKKENRPPGKIIWIAYTLIFAVTLFIFVGSAINRINNSQVWDFTAFYLYGKVAASGHNFYVPENFHTVFNSLTLPALDYRGFVEEAVNVGFLYPPPTILLFTPLGFLSYNTALICWTIFNILFALGCIYLIYHLFFKSYKLKGLMLVAILFFLFTPVRSTVSFSQTNFILLFLLLLMKKYSDRKFAGILLALALFTKPYMIIFVLVFLLRKQWKTIIYFIMSSLILVGSTVLLFGKAPFISYIFDNPSKRLPVWVFSEGINQSLHAVLLRANLITIDNHILYTCILTGGLIVTAIYLIYLLKRKLYDYIWAALLLVGLMLYPGTLSYYGVLLLFITFQFFDEKNPLGVSIYVNIPIICLFYYLTSFSVFTCIWLLLIITVCKSLKPVANHSRLRLVLQTST